MTDPRLLQDDSPDVAAQVRAATANSAYVPENEYDDANPGPSRPMTGLPHPNVAEIAAKAEAQTEAYEAENGDYGKVARDYQEITQWPLRRPLPEGQAYNPIAASDGCTSGDLATLTAAGLYPSSDYLSATDYTIRLDALTLANQDAQGLDADEIVDFAMVFEAYLRGETKIEQTVPGEGTGG